MAIPHNKNLTKQLNNYSYVIAITLQSLLQRTKRAQRSGRGEREGGQNIHLPHSNI